MKEVYCWKCKAFIPMPEGREYEIYSCVHRECVDAIKGYLRANRVSVDQVPLDMLELLRQPAYRKYEELTQYRPVENSFDHLFHHNADEYGGPCRRCGKNLRTSLARFCAECGEKRD
jgi:hypothetical protein